MKNLFNFLIKALGGRTEHEYELAKTTADSWRTRAIAAETTVELFRDIVARERERSDRVEERLTGQKAAPQPIQTGEPMQPLGSDKRSSWPRIRRELEREDRMKSNAGVSREKIESEIRSGQ